MHGHTIDFMKREDLAEVRALCSLDPELVFQGWENEQLLARMIEAYPSYNLVVRCEEGKIIGASLGAVFHGRGTIPHIIIDPAHQHRRLGSQVVARTLDEFRRAGCSISHVFVTQNNVSGRRFWNHRMGFLPSVDRIALEGDIESDIQDVSSIEELNASSYTEIARFLGEDVMQLLLHPLSTILVARDVNGDLEAAVVVGSFGVRGIISRVVTRDGSEARLVELIQAAKAWVAKQGVFRLHAILDRSDAAVSTFLRNGFADISVELVEISLVDEAIAA